MILTWLDLNNVYKTVLLDDLSKTYSKPNDMFRDLRLWSSGKRRVNVYTTCLPQTIRKRAQQVPKTILLETVNKNNQNQITRFFFFY